MSDTQSNMSDGSIARLTGITLILIILFGIGQALTVSQGIDINLTADFVGTPAAMMEAEMSLRAMAYFSIIGFALNCVFLIGLYRLLKPVGSILPLWCLCLGLFAAFMTLMGGVFTMNAALLAGNDGFAALTSETQLTLLTSLQAATNYTAFHMGLILSSLSMAGYFWLFFQSGKIPSLLSGFGLTASLFVAIAIGLRDFVPFLASDAVTVTFMAGNLFALVGLGVYLAIWRVRDVRA